MEDIKEYIKNKKELLKHKLEIEKVKLAIVQVNDDPASNIYVKNKLKDCEELGIKHQLIKLPEDISEENLLSLIDILNNDDSVTGFIVQMPLPKHINEELVKRSVTPSKDVDGFNPLSTYAPATPHGIVTFLEDNNYKFDGKNALVIGRSNIVGKPMAKLLLDLNMNVTVVHSHTKEEDLKDYVKKADLIIVAVGKPYFLNKKFEFKKDAVVFDVGINRIDGHLVGDAEPDLPVSFQSPVPGGVGLLTRLSLLLNLLEVFKDEL